MPTTNDLRALAGQLRYATWPGMPSPVKERFAEAASPQAILALLDDLDRLTELSSLLRKELDGHGAHLDQLQQENDQLVRDLDARIADDKAEVKALRSERDRLREALERIVQWSDAYPLTVFPEPDFARAATVLAEAGMTLDAISASNMRHAISGAGEIARAAIHEGAADE